LGYGFSRFQSHLRWVVNTVCVTSRSQVAHSLVPGFQSHLRWVVNTVCFTSRSQVAHSLGPGFNLATRI
jgi:hypothetical protein